MIPALVLGIALETPETSCHTTALLMLHSQYTDKQIGTIVRSVFPPWTFVVCSFTVSRGRRSVEVRYGPQTRPIS
jgi:hypothetical protein